MDLYGNKVQFAVNNGGLQVGRVARVVEVIKLPELGPFGCAPCHSGDSPIFDLEQNVLGF